jgi:proline/glycine betaine ABC superfamily ATP binding cassette transporter, membrane protein
MLNQITEYFYTDFGSYIKYVGEHVGISIEALIIALIIGVPAGYLCFKHRILKKYIIFIAQGLRVIPSLAVLFILIPLVGVGRLPALIALVFLAIPPILINTNLGLEEIPGVYIESAYGMGMDNKMMLRKILFPLALPYILTGVRLALVEIIASATLAAYIGAGGLGSLIITGLGLYRMDLLIIGGGSVAILSMLTMIIFDLTAPNHERV